MSAIQESKNGEAVPAPSSSPMKSPKSSPTKKDIDVATQALNHFAQGKRHLLVSDVNSAVNSLQEACRLLAEHYGETAFECADAYYYYGRALLEMARIENGVLGNALDGVPEGDDADNSQVEDPEKMTEDERDLVSEAVGEALEENFKENEKKVKCVENGVSSNSKEIDAEEMELSISLPKSNEKVADSKESNSVIKSKESNSVEKSEESKPVKKSEESKPVKKSEESKPVEKPEESKPVEKPEESKPVEKSEESKPVEKSEESKPVEKSEESKPVEKSEESKPVKKSEESKPVEKSKPVKKSEESKPVKKSEESKPVKNSPESKTVPKPEESKPVEKPEESKPVEKPEESKMDTCDSSTKETSEDNKENLESKVDKKINEKAVKSILKETSNQKEGEKIDSELIKDEAMEVESVPEKEEGSTESEGECDKKEVEEDGADEEADEESKEGEDEAEESQEEPEGDQTEEEEDVGNLQLSWEMFELSKVIYLKQETVNQQKVAQVYLKLGEVGLESENYSQSIEDFTSCLEIQKKILQSDDRCLAETYYQLGVAHSFSDDFDKAMDNFSAAANVIETRISNLKNIIKDKETWTEEQKHKAVTEQEDPFYSEQGEIDELDKLLPEIKEKLVDMEEMKKDTKEKLEKVKEATFASVLGGSRSAGSSSGEASTSEGFSSGFSEVTKDTSVNKIETKPTSNISHLIRKKRKPEEDAEKEDLKKAKSDGETKQILSVNGSLENGDTSKPDKMETDSVPADAEGSKAVAVVDDKMDTSTTT